MKPLLAGAFGTGEAPDADRVAAALTALEQAEALAESRLSEEAGQDEWLLTALTAVQVLGVLGEPLAAQGRWEQIQAQPWARAQVAEVGQPMGSKALLAQVALALAQGDLDQVATSARQLHIDASQHRYRDRLRRARVIEGAAERGVVVEIRQAILR